MFWPSDRRPLKKFLQETFNSMHDCGLQIGKQCREFGENDTQRAQRNYSRAMQQLASQTENPLVLSLTFRFCI